MHNETNRFVVALQDLKTRVHTCQESHAFTSCLPCPKVLECELRDHYVKSVYESMSQGETGGFEF